MTMLAQFAAAAGGVLPAYIEDVFSTYLYTGTGATQTITNGIDLAGEGGLTWMKSRTSNPSYDFHVLMDTARPTGGVLMSNATDAQSGGTFTTYNNNGFTINAGYSAWNSAGQNYASWTFRKQPKFFDVVTYTGTGSLQTIPHNLGSEPGCIFYKSTSVASDWIVYHRSLYNSFPSADILKLNTTDAKTGVANVISGVTSTNFSVGANTGSGSPNQSGQTYVAYLFAHNAGGFGLSGNENVVSCGSYTGTGVAGLNVTLGYEPQWLLIKRSNGTGDWALMDNMRGIATGGLDVVLRANTTNADIEAYDYASLTATGFQLSEDIDVNTSGGTYIYIAIRRGPMKVPTLGTTVYNGITRTGTGAVAQVTGVGFPPDLVASGFRNFGGPPTFFDKLRGPLQYLTSSATDAEATRAGTLTAFNQDGFSLGADAFNLINFNTGTFVDWNFRRAPSFFDEVCYTGTGGASQTFTHNLGVAPELVIVKCRGAAAAWESLGTALSASQRQIYLNRTQAGVAVASGHLGWNGTDGAYKAPTSSVVYFGGDSDVGGSGLNYVAYLFATCAGVSKVGSYTGTGTTQAIACGFTTGARFVMIKRTDAVGDWYVWDSARGIVAGNDPYLLFNSTAAEVTGTDYVDTSATGFELTSTAPAAINASGGSYIFLAVA